MCIKNIVKRLMIHKIQYDKLLITTEKKHNIYNLY